MFEKCEGGSTFSKSYFGIALLWFLNHLFVTSFASFIYFLDFTRNVH